MTTYRNNVASAVSGTPGTGTITLGSAVTGAQSFAAAYGANATVDVFITDGNAWEVARGCTYTHSGTTLTRGTLEASSTGAVLSLTSAAVVRVAMPASVAQNFAFASLAGPDSATTMQVGRRYLIDLSTFTANRTYTLPAVCAVGDRVQVVVTVGSATREVLLTAASGDTLNGVAGGTEWSRLFITGEVATFVCTAANAAWVVELDGRIPQKAKMWLSTAADNESASTYTRPTAAAVPGAWTVEFDNAGGLCSVSNDRLVPRRSGLFSFVVSYAPKDAGTSGAFVNLEVRIDGSTVIGGPSGVITASNVNRVAATLVRQISVGQYVDYWYRTGDGNIGVAASQSLSNFSIIESLP
jgi:hypothetical protein